ncbi:MAG: vitamin B12-dependent ribonucleotide reductase [Candidatus Wukongarchaeota archaeon]|nr:vitamin B12-dependent ribonucleotide reductase [Candidatus Wukongarchaeota archaeon]
MISKIRKRDGRIVNFDSEKIVNAIHKAIVAVGERDSEVAKSLANKVVKIVKERFVEDTPSVENVQDIVEDVLINEDFTRVAKAYILYRQKRTELREAKTFFGVRDDLKLTLNAIRVLEKRYLLKDEKGHVVETPAQMFRRVAKAIASIDLIYDKEVNVDDLEEKFYEMMANLEFVPNSPTLMNAGTDLSQLAACFVLPVFDSLESIFETLKHMALIHQSGGGTGFSFSNLRPRGDLVKSTMGVASGPVSFMRIYNVTTDVIKQGGKRRGANMGILRYDHPDILEFITSKQKEGFLENFNISVAVTDAFMRAVENDEEYYFINPRTNKQTTKVRARNVFDLIINSAWSTGDPGLVFIDEINRHNPTPNVGVIESTNPCGEVPLLFYEACNLGSINLSKMIKKGENAIDWENLRKTVRKAVHFLDNVIDASKFPLSEIKEMVKANRKIGLGIMGFADMLIQLGIPYDSEEALKLAEKIMSFIEDEAVKMSVEIAEVRDSFQNFKGSIWDKQGFDKIRNSTLTTIAPTGTISIIAGCSSGIEPLFSVSFVRNVLGGSRLVEVNPFFEKIAKERGFYSSELMTKIAKKGSVQDMEEIPPDVRRLFVTSLDIAPEWHIKMQASFQKYVDNAVSKTINLPHDAIFEDVKKAYLLAYKLKCKGITVYRYGSKKEQVLTIGGKKEGKTLEYVSVDEEYSGGCPTGECIY